MPLPWLDNDEVRKSRGRRNIPSGATVAPVPPRVAMLGALRRAIEAGTYYVPAEQVAQAIIDEDYLSPVLATDEHAIRRMAELEDR